MRMDPLFSPNTGEFLVILTAPWLPPEKTTKDPKDPTKDLKAKDPSANAPKLQVLAIKAESLVNPVLPTGFGFAVVAPDGKVFFHSSAVRNMNEDFTKEARGNVSLQACWHRVAPGYWTSITWVQRKKYGFTPFEAAIHPRLTLVVFKDSADTTTMNMAVVIVFSVLVMCYAIILFSWSLAATYSGVKEYPLEVIWPNCALKSHYIHLVIANSALSIAYFERYVCYGLTRALLTVLGVALVAAAYRLLNAGKNGRV